MLAQKLGDVFYAMKAVRGDGTPASGAAPAKVSSDESFWSTVFILQNMVLHTCDISQLLKNFTVYSILHSRRILMKLDTNANQKQNFTLLHGNLCYIFAVFILEGEHLVIDTCFAKWLY